jgi:hypothetical protein
VAVGDDAGMVSWLRWPDQATDTLQPSLLKTVPWLDSACQGLTWVANGALLAASSETKIVLGDPSTGSKVAQLTLPRCRLVSLTVDSDTCVLFMVNRERHLYFACVQRTDDGWRCSAYHRVFGSLDMRAIRAISIADCVLYLGGAGILAIDLHTWCQRWKGQGLDSKQQVSLAISPSVH